MKRLPVLWPILIPALLVLHCTKEDHSPMDDPGANNHISFSNPQVGQMSRYVLFKGEKYFDDNTPDAFAYFPDTLVLEIVEKLPGGYLIEEYLTNNSQSKTSSSPDVPFPDSVFVYELVVDQDSLEIIHGESDYPSRVLSFYNRPISLSVFDSNPTTFEGWKTTLSYCECYREASLEHFTLFGRTYHDLNLLIDNEAMQVDGPGFTLAYSAKAGWVRAYVVNWWTQTGRGWDLLP